MHNISVGIVWQCTIFDKIEQIVNFLQKCFNVFFTSIDICNLTLKVSPYIC